MKLTEEAQATLNELFVNSKDGSTIFNTTTIYNAGRSNGMKFRVIRETFMIDNLKVAYGKYDLRLLNEDGVVEQSINAIPIPVAKKAAAKKAAAKKAHNTQLSETLSKKEAKMIKDSANWEVVYDAQND
jgi:hypothetical protein